MSHRPSFPVARNSTIKQEQDQHPNNLDNDSSISLRQGNNDDVHYYDLDYSDEHSEGDIAGSSDQEGREISHEEFIQMFSTNMPKKLKSSQSIHSNYSRPNYDLNQDEDQEYQRERPKPKGKHPAIGRKPHNKKYPLSNDFKHSYYHQNPKKISPSTRDKSYNIYDYAHKQKKEKNDPEKSSGQHQRNIKNSKDVSYSHDFSVNSVKEFKIDSFSYGRPSYEKKENSKAWKDFRQMKKKPQIQQDSSFSLITLPQYDEESSSSMHKKQKISQSLNKRNHQIQTRRMSKYKNVAKMQEEEENAYNKLNWRYEEAKLKFMDSFLPETMKIGNNGYNMLKYMARKNDLTFNILKVV